METLYTIALLALDVVRANEVNTSGKVGRPSCSWRIWTGLVERLDNGDGSGEGGGHFPKWCA